MGIPDEAFRQGDVFIDYPCEQAMFRWEARTKKVFRKWYGKDEMEDSPFSMLFSEAKRSGTMITAEKYAQGRNKRTVRAKTAESPEKYSRLKKPKRRDVMAQLCALIDGRATRDEVCKWSKMHLLDRHLEIDDPAVLKTLNRLALVTGLSDWFDFDPSGQMKPDEHYEYNENDFKEWLKELS